MSSADTQPRQSISEAAPIPSNPLVEETRVVRESLKTSEVPASRVIEEPRVVRESARTVAKIEPPSAISVEDPPAPPPTPESRPHEQQRVAEVREFRNPHALPPNRITGPSFLGLSDESSDTSESSYLLDDDQPQRSHWRAWVAIAVLALLAFLIYKQWRAVKAGAMEVAQRATASAASNTTAPPPKPEGGVSDNETASTASTTPSTDAASTSSNNLDKPENDKTEQAPTASKDGTPSTAADTTTASAAKDKDQSDQVAKKESTDTASEEVADDEVADSQPTEPTTAKSAKKSEPAPAQAPQFDNAAVDQAERYLRGQGVAQNCSRAISLLRSAAREGNPHAQVKLGALYATGRCVTQDRAAAYQWLARAQEAQPTNSYLQRTMNNLWANMTPEERDRITR